MFVLSMLSGLLIALQLLLPAVAFASVNAGGGETARALPPQQQEALDLAGVSVVRLVVTYKVTGTNPENSLVACTGIGTLIASGSPTIDNNSWVLTDSSLVHLSGTTCTGIAGQLASITISPNTTYTNTSSIPGRAGSKSSNRMSSGPPYWWYWMRFIVAAYSCRPY